jgi:hypothetical protein
MIKGSGGSWDEGLEASQDERVDEEGRRKEEEKK